MRDDQVTGSAASEDEAPEPSDRHAAPEMVRSEEELVVGTRAHERERVRLVKRVVTETVTTTTDVRREELHVERLPVDGRESSPSSAQPFDAERSEADTGGFPGRIRDRLAPLGQRLRSAAGSPTGRVFEENVTELTLMEEEVVVTKRVVPRERVRLRKEVVTVNQEINEDVRKEEVTLERSGASDEPAGIEDAAARRAP